MDPCGGSEWRKKIVHLEPESQIRQRLWRGDFREDEKQFDHGSWLSIEDRYLICLLLGGVVGRESLGLFAWKYAKYVEFLKQEELTTVEGVIFNGKFWGYFVFPVIIIAQPLLLFMLKRSAGVKFPFEGEYHQGSSIWSIKHFVQILQGYSCYLPHLIHQFIPTESDVFIFSFLRSPSLRFGFMSFWVILTWLQRWWMARLLGYCKWDATFSMLWGGFFDDT